MNFITDLLIAVSCQLTSWFTVKNLLLLVAKKLLYRNWHKLRQVQSVVVKMNFEWTCADKFGALAEDEIVSY